MMKVSRKRFQEALRALKQAAKNDKLPYTLRIRAAELICAIYGVQVGDSPRNKRAIRDLVDERQFEKELRQQINEQQQQEAVESAQRYLENR